MSNRILSVATVLVVGLPAIGAAQSTRSALWPVASVGAGVAGGGGYAGAGTGMRPGWNAGLGFVVPIRGHEFLLETRYHEWQRPGATGRAAASRYFVPLTLRLRF